MRRGVGQEEWRAYSITKNYKRVTWIMKTYYENVSELKELKKLSIPNKSDVEKVREIIRDDPELTLYFYDVLNPEWIDLLDEAGEFHGLREKETGMIGKYKAHYLKQCAETQAEAVLGIIERIEARDVNIQGTLIKAIVGMPEDIAAKGVSVVLGYLAGRENKVWYSIGSPAGELMVKLVISHPDKAFEIAEAFLDAWVSNEKTYGKEIIAKFSKDEYSRLMLKHYKKVWEANPERAIEVLVKILNQCLKDLDEKEDASRYFGYGLELGDLNEIDMQRPEIKTILVKGICEAGKVLIDKEPGKISVLLDMLEETNRIIFLRIAMYLLRFVKPGTEKERISKIVGNKEYFKEYNPCWYEHRRLLNDKFDDVSEVVKKAFLEWVEEDKYSNERREEIAKWTKENYQESPDFEKWENVAKAEELYLVRGKFKEEYERYKKDAGVKNDSELAPRKAVSEASFVSPEEGSTYSSEKMANDSAESVITFLLEPKNYEGVEKVGGFWTGKNAMASSFGADVRKRPAEYLKVDLKVLELLAPEFLAKFFHAVSESVRDGSFKKEEWERLIDLACKIVEAKKKEKEWRECFLAILWVFHDGFVEEDNRIKFNEAIIKKLWLVLKELVEYNHDEKSDLEEDPFQRQLRSVQGGAFNQIVLLAIVCKKKYAPIFESLLEKEIEQIYTFIAKKVKRSEVNCTLGYRFASIYWLNKEWVELNFEQIFDDKIWDAVWGTYVSWGRPSPQCFRFLVDKGIYGRAVERIGEKNRYKFDKEPEKGLVEHLMIGYFNGWITLEDSVLIEFFKKAPAELQGEAAGFLTTGFKSVNEEDKTEEKEKVAERIKEYWNKRLEAIKERGETDSEEARELTGWVCDSLLPAKETLDLLAQSLGLSGGKVGKMRGARDFVEGVTKLGKGNEMLALQCLMLASGDKEMNMPWSSIQEPLVNFLEKMVDMPKEVRSVAIEVADAYGRYNSDKFSAVWEKLNWPPPAAGQ